MRSLSKSFASRLATLEQLDAKADARDERFPPAHTLSDTDVAIVVCNALEGGCYNLWYDKPHAKVWCNVTGLIIDRAYSAWLYDLNGRAQALLDRHYTAIAARIPPNNGDGRKVVAAAVDVLDALYGEVFDAATATN